MAAALAGTTGAGLTPDLGTHAAPPAVDRTARPRREARNWSVQVGSFRNQRAARAQVEDVARRFSRLFDDAEGSVDGGGRTWRARFSGLTETAAREACSTMKAKNAPCVASRG